MMCKTGCGRHQSNWSYVCDACALIWQDSTEYKRTEAMPSDASTERFAGAFFDFCTRTRAERLNGGVR